VDRSVTHAPVFTGLPSHAAKEVKVMAKTIVSAFHSSEAAAQVLNSIVSDGFDSRLFSVIEPARPTAARSFDAVLHDVTSIQARLYQRDLRMGDSLLVARVNERDVTRVIKLLQSIGGHHIEAFDPVKGV
jgi:hypothetical protein